MWKIVGDSEVSVIYIYIYKDRERERERERWVQVTPGVTSQELHLLWTIDYF